jgi:hypothetical protein
MTAAQPKTRSGWRRAGLIVLVLLPLLGACALLFNFTQQWALTHVRNFSTELQQVSNALEKGQSNPGGATLEAQRHLVAARTELEILRPVVEPGLTIAGWFVGLPLVGQPIQEATALWTFADEATRLGEELLNGVGVALAGIDLSSSEARTPAKIDVLALRAHLQAAEASFLKAKEARAKLKSVTTWLPADLQPRFSSSLSRWDDVAPTIGIALFILNRLPEELDLNDTWAHTAAFSHELQQAGALFAQMSSAEDTEAIRQAQTHLVAARQEFEAIHAVMWPVLSRTDEMAQLTGDLPARQVKAWWEFADATTMLAADLSQAIDLAADSLQNGEGASGLIAGLPTIQEYLNRAEVNFYRAQAARQELVVVAWMPTLLKPSSDALFARWDQLAPHLEKIIPDANRLVKLLPVAMGSERPLTYLVIVQASNNLRATGGFVTGAGYIRVEKGQVVEVVMGEVTEFEKDMGWTEDDWKYGVSGEGIIPPPDLVTHYLGLGHWVLRDGNWWADFPTTARQLVSLWQVANDIPVDGVIAINDRGVERLLEVLGTAELEGGEEVGAGNLEEVATVRVYGEDRDQSKFHQDFANAIVTLFNDLPPERVPRVFDYLRTVGAHHDLLATSFEPEVAALLHQMGVDGALRGHEDDYIYLVEDNLSDSKLNPFVQKDLRYEVDLDPTGRPTLSQLTVEYINNYTQEAQPPGQPDENFFGGQWNPKTRVWDIWRGYYGGYVRLFTPPGSRYVAAVGFDEGPHVREENKRTFIGGYIGLWPDLPRQLEFKWIPTILPAEEGRYQLLVQRQPGTLDHALSVAVNLPPGYRAVEVTPPPIASAEGSITWHTPLNEDRIFSLRLEPGDTPPATPTQAVTATSAVSATAAPPPTLWAFLFPGQSPLPVELGLPTLGITAPVIAVGQEENGIMASPSDPDSVAWYALGPRPGDASNAIMSGHVSWGGRDGVFKRLHELQPGDKITVRSGVTSHYNYVVESLEHYQADTAPIAEIFEDTSPNPILTLITCAGPYDPLEDQYRDRLVVRARLDRPE